MDVRIPAASSAFSALRVLALFMVCSPLADATAASSEARQQMIRKHQVVELNAAGAFSKQPDELGDSVPPEEVPGLEELQAAVFDMMDGGDVEDASDEIAKMRAAQQRQQELTTTVDLINACNMDFERGVPDSSNCTNDKEYMLILTESECRDAAHISKATIANHEDFVVDYYHRDKHPMGCFFKKDCKDDAEGCFYFNPIGDWPRAPVGTPICSRARFLNGTYGTDGQCPAGYQALKVEALCQEIKDCINKPIWSNKFLAGEFNFSAHWDFPEGCFISSIDDHLWFNQLDPKFGRPAMSGLKGTPVCEVTLLGGFKAQKDELDEAPRASPAAEGNGTANGTANGSANGTADSGADTAGNGTAGNTT